MEPVAPSRDFHELPARLLALIPVLCDLVLGDAAPLEDIANGLDISWRDTPFQQCRPNARKIRPDRVQLQLPERTVIDPHEQLVHRGERLRSRVFV
jgi:hypothetical protein